jgi:hypothetical protein
MIAEKNVHIDLRKRKRDRERKCVSESTIYRLLPTLLKKKQQKLNRRREKERERKNSCDNGKDEEGNDFERKVFFVVQLCLSC